MSQSASAGFLLVLAFAAANMPFLSERVLAVFALSGPKSLGWRLLELMVLYFLVGGAGLWLEQRAGQIVRQGWEFYAVTTALFLTFAFPGFVYRYLVRRRG